MNNLPLTVLCAILGAVIGSILGAALGVELTMRGISHILHKVDLDLTVKPEVYSGEIAAPVRVALAVEIPPLDPVVVPITTAAAPSIQELAERVLAVYPNIGPTDLAAIVGCAKSTAHAIIAAHRPATETTEPPAAPDSAATIARLLAIRPQQFSQQPAVPIGPEILPAAEEDDVVIAEEIDAYPATPWGGQ